MQVKIVYDEQEYNTGTIYIGNATYRYDYDTNINELICNLLSELDIEYENRAFNYSEEDE